MAWTAVLVVVLDGKIHNYSASLCYISVSGHLCSHLHGDLMFSLLNRLGLGLASNRLTNASVSGPVASVLASVSA